MTSARTGPRPAARRAPARRPSPGRTPAERPPARRSTGSRPAARRRRNRSLALRSWGPFFLVCAVLLAVLVWRADGAAPTRTEVCTVPASSVTLSAEQVENARTIAQVARDRGLPERATVIALATAMQESTLRNLDHGDRDSLGLFQQRPSQGWGTPEQVQDPVYAAGQFYDRLVRVPDWETGELTLVADAVQRSAFPLAYGRWSDFAQSLTAALRSDDFQRNCA